MAEGEKSYVRCPECGAQVFWLLIVAEKVVVSGKQITFTAPDATVNINGLRCYECDNDQCDAFGGTWEVEATATGNGRIEGEKAG